MNFISKANKGTSVLILLLNLYYIPMTLKIIIARGGPWGYGLLALPIFLTFNLCLISAYHGFRGKNSESLGLLMFNLIASVVGAYILYELAFKLYFE
ncbi:hypothetical protein [Flammeovirga sp. SJP92]|uniref:hypothetical protein n=1 Tax=Flammeovirga sp. SJP92 TaxID=1775430 RepID=UPI0012FC114F|nr:hypothetical protein [Flammeovirga sp. SJP92]